MQRQKILACQQLASKIFLTDLAAHGAGSSPMFSKRGFDVGPQEYVQFFILGNSSLFLGPTFTALLIALKHQVDISISYKGGSSDYTSFASDDLKTTVYHELTHTGEYAKLGKTWYSQFVASEISEIVSTIGSGNSPYGGGSNSSVDPIIGLGESWAYHIGHYFADKRYGYSYSSSTGEQGILYYNGTGIAGLSSHLITLENFNPNYTSDPFRWIPKGLYYDLLDTRNETKATGGPVDDYVLGFTNQQFFNAFSSSIKDVSSYKTNLISQNPGNQTTQVTNLFQQYGY